MAAIAFFDADDTLLKGTSGIMLAKLLLLHKGERIEPKYAWELLKIYFQSKFKAFKYDTIVEYGLGRFEGRSAAELEDVCVECFDRYMVKAIYRGGCKEIKRHQRIGNRAVLLTASIKPLMEMLGEYLGMDDVIATEPIIEDGVMTDRVEKPFCYGDGKRVLAQEYADRFGIPLSDCYFYSDSISDLPLLEAVGNPVATNPDRVLFVTALMRNWRILWFNSVLQVR
ncbi:MAG: HAD-IB family hydrolase [bacterium]